MTKTDEVRLKNSILARTLLSYKNVFFKYLNVKQFAKDTPTAAFIESGKLDKSSHAVAHTSDVFRLLILWKFGGTYLDLDVITLKSQNMTNYLCFEITGVPCNAVMNFQRTAKDTVKLVIE